jgi:hypothetical protein
MQVSENQRQSIENGVATFWRTLEEIAPERYGVTAEEMVNAIEQPAGRERYMAALRDLIEERFPRESEVLVLPSAADDLQSKRSSLSTCVIRALRYRLCGDPEAVRTLRKVIAEAKTQGVRLTDPTAEGLSAGAASLVAMAVGSLFSGPIAIAAASVLGGFSYLLLRAGVDGFCEWSADKPEAPETK